MEINSDTSTLPASELEFYIYEHVRLLRSSRTTKAALEKQFVTTLSKENNLDLREYFTTLILLTDIKNPHYLIATLLVGNYTVTSTALPPIKEDPLEWRYDDKGRAISARRNVFGKPFARMVDSTRVYTTIYTDREIFNCVRHHIRNRVHVAEVARLERLNSTTISNNKNFDADEAESFLEERRRTKRVMSLRDKLTLLDDKKARKNAGSSSIEPQVVEEEVIENNESLSPPAIEVVKPVEKKVKKKKKIVIESSSDEESTTIAKIAIKKAPVSKPPSATVNKTEPSPTQEESTPIVNESIDTTEVVDAVAEEVNLKSSLVTSAKQKLYRKIPSFLSPKKTLEAKTSFSDKFRKMSFKKKS